MQFKDHPQPAPSKVYLIQEVPGTAKGEPKYNIIGAQKYGDIVTMLPEFSQMISSPGPIVSDLTGGKYNLLKWDRQEKTYYPIELNIHQK